LQQPAPAAFRSCAEGALDALTKFLIHLAQLLARPAALLPVVRAGSPVASLLVPLVGGSPRFRYMGTPGDDAPGRLGPAGAIPQP
jgi:hypothetical protein